MGRRNLEREEEGGDRRAPCTCNVQDLDHWTALVDDCARHPEIAEYLRRRNAQRDYRDFSDAYDRQFRGPWKRIREDYMQRYGTRDAARALLTGPGTAQQAARRLADSMPRAPKAEPPPLEGPVELPQAFDLRAMRTQHCRQLERLPDVLDSAPEASFCNAMIAWCDQNPEAGREEYRRKMVELRVMSAAGVA